jgi:hypothetical protein
MSVRKFELGDNWDVSYLEGEVTPADVIIEEPQEHFIEPTDDYPCGSLTTTVTIRLKDELRDLIYGEDRKPDYNESEHVAGGDGFRRLYAFTPVRQNTQRAIKSMRTRHKKECKRAFRDGVVQDEINRVVHNTNWKIKDSRDRFVLILASNMGQVESWDNKPRLDELGTVREELKKKIKEIENEMRALMRSEINEWLTEKGCDEELKQSILEKAKFKYIPEVLEIS